MVLPATASRLPVPRIDTARVGGTGHSPVTRDSEGSSSESRQASTGGGASRGEVFHVFASGLYLAVDDRHSPRGPGRRLLPIMSPAALLLPFGLSVPQLGPGHLATLRTGTPARVSTAASPTQPGPHPPIFEDHLASPRRIEFPDFALEVVRTHRPLGVKAQSWWGLDPSALAVLAGNLRPGISDLPSRAGDLVLSLLAGDVTDTEAAMRALIGAGPGSTPSGDDALCGIALALRCTSRNPPLDLFSRAVESIDLAQTTPALSAALIRAAVAGHCVPEAAAAIEAARCLLTTSANRPVAETPTDEYATVFTPLDRIGHSSGHDLFTGFLAVLTAIADSRPSRTESSPAPPPRPPSAEMTRIRGSEGPENPSRITTQHSSKGTQPCHAH